MQTDQKETAFNLAFARAMRSLREAFSMSFALLSEETGIADDRLRAIEASDQGPTLYEAVVIGGAFRIGPSVLIQLVRRAL